MRRLLAGMLLIAAMGAPAYAGGRERLGDLPAPTLKSPNEEATVGPKGLEFRWSPEGDRSATRHFDFRLYKGSQTYEKAQILSERLDAGVNRFVVKPELFEVGGTYSWSVRAVGSKKGRSSYSIFKVVSKA